jgi:hypothetical protein
VRQQVSGNRFSKEGAPPMADESHVVRGINWREAFPFTQIFRAFRVAIHPTKLILALVALIALYAGGWLLDSVWPVQSRAIPRVTEGTHTTLNEVELFEGFSPTGGESFDELIKARRKDLEAHYAEMLEQTKIEPDAAKARDAAKGGNLLGKFKDEAIKLRDKQVEQEIKNRDDTIKAVKDAYDAKAKNASSEIQHDEAVRRDDAIAKAESDYRKNVREAYIGSHDAYERISTIKGQGIFSQFFAYEVAQVNNVSHAVLANDWLGGFSGNPAGMPHGAGVLESIKNFCVTGPWWIVRYHTTYFILFVVLFSIIWAIFGGAISRIAAVHVARDEKISLSNALRFSTSKFLSFIFAPIIPLIIVLVVGLIVTIGGLLGNIPVLGPVLVGVFFFLALAAGFVMTLVLLGTGGGYNLMYPTIAVEGSDSFDAISRSFSYVYARPWRMLFYSLVSVFYGALCYLFVRYFIAILLILTHHFVGAGMMSNVEGSKVPIDLWNTMWPAPEGHGFVSYDIDSMTLGPAQSLGAYLVSFWVYLAAGLVGAFAISFYFSANTIIYYLMRREVDATELDDVYLEQSEEDFGDTTHAPPPPITPPVEAPPAPTPPAT